MLCSETDALLVQATTIGIVIASLVNYCVQDYEWGWRLSIGLAAAPAAVFLVGSCILDDTPNSLLLNDKPEKANKVHSDLRDRSLEFCMLSCDCWVMPLSGHFDRFAAKADGMPAFPTDIQRGACAKALEM